MGDETEKGAGSKGKKTEKGAGTSKFVVDVMSQYYIGPSDNPNQLHVGEVLRDDNYVDWANEMSNALFAKNKIGFVDGSTPMPKEGSQELDYWKRCNAMVKGWLMAAMEKDIKNSIKHATTAREIWVDLKDRFGKGSAPRAYELRQGALSLRQEKLSVSTYFTKLKAYWDEIQSVSPTPRCICDGCTCDVQKELREMREKEHLFDFLMGLDDTFSTIKTQILSTTPTPSLGAAYHLVAEDEQQRLISAARKPTMEGAAFQASLERERKPGEKQNLSSTISHQLQPPYANKEGIYIHVQTLESKKQ